MALEAMRKGVFANEDQLRGQLFALYAVTIGVSAMAAIWAGRMEMIEVFLRAQPDIDLYPPQQGGLKAWRWIGRLLIAGAIVLALIGVNSAMSDDVLEAGWLITIAAFPAAFGIVMARKVPDQAYKLPLALLRAPRR
jgi:4-hydroxybenzoate polyprenyltransferase